MLYMLDEDTIERLRRQLAKAGPMRPAPVTPAQYQGFTVYEAPPEWVGSVPPSSSKANKALTLSAAHRLIGQLADDTLSRETQAECRDVMAKLERMVEEG